MLTKEPVNTDEAESLAVLASLKEQHDNWIGAIQEAAIEKRVLLPKYEFGQDVAPAHHPVFVCRVMLCGVMAEAKGPSKQAAKQAAAKAWIELCSEDP